MIYNERYLEYVDKYIRDIFDLLIEFGISNKKDIKLEIEHLTIGDDKFSAAKYMQCSNSINVRFDVDAMCNDVSFEYLVFELFYKMVYAFKFAQYLPELDSTIDQSDICRQCQLIDTQADYFISTYGSTIMKSLKIQ